MLDFAKFRIITFDCYGTLIDWEAGILGALRPIFSRHGCKVEDSEALRIYGELEVAAETGTYRSYRDVLREVVSGFGQRLGFSPSDSEQNSLAESLKNWQPFPDTVAALRQIKEKMLLGIISNVDDDLFAATRHKLQTDFHLVVTAGQAHAYKPSLKIFELAESKLGYGRREWLHAAQSVHHDIVPAKALGIGNVWVNRPSARPNVGAVVQSSAKADVEVNSLAELAKLIAG